MKKTLKQGTFIAVILSVTIALFVTATFAAEVKPVNGLTLSDTQNNIKNENGTVTATASGFLSKKTNTITITNSGTEKANISFSFAITGDVDSCTDPWGGTDRSGDYSATLGPGDKVKIIIKNTRDFATTTATLTLSNFKYQIVGDAVTATLQYDNAMGAVTVAGAAKNNGDRFEIGEAGVAVAATAKTGYEFVAWINADTNEVLSTKASDTLMPVTGLANVKAVFETKGGQGWYLAGGNKLYSDFSDAVTYAAGQSTKTVVLLNNATMSAGTYTVTSGVIFLIPFDAANTLYTDAPAHDNHAGFVNPTAYRTLTMAQGAKIVVESGGAVSLSAKHHSGSPGQTAGAPTGPCSFVNMNSGSSITVEGGGSLYAWGYITGSGDVSVESGGTVYEYFQFNDFRGGSHSSWALVMGGKEKGVFPVNSYFIQNIHVKLKLDAGATEKCYTTVYASDANNSAPFTFIAGSGAMFNITNGNLVKRYDVNSDRLIVDVNGEITLSSMSMTLMGQSMDSTNYNLPLNSNITINLNTGSKVTVGQHLAMLPSSEINIAEGASMTVASGKRVIVYDKDDWKAAYNWPTSAQFNTLAYVPGRAEVNKLTDSKLKDASICVSGTLTATEGYLYTTSNGANIYSTGAGVVKMTVGSDKSTLQVTALATSFGLGAASTEEVAITSAKLKNGYGIKDEYVPTAERTGEVTYYYHPVHQIWVAGGHKPKTTDPTNEGYGFCTCGAMDYNFQYSNQIGWDKENVKVWYLRSNLYVKHGSNFLMPNQANTLSDYGVYFMTQTQWDAFKKENPSLITNHDKPSIENMLKFYEGQKKVAVTTGKGDYNDAGYLIVTGDLPDSIATDDLATENVYVLFYIDVKGADSNSFRFYGQVMKRNLKELAEAALKDTTGRKPEEIEIYQVMTGAAQAAAENQATFVSVPKMPSYMSAAPSVGYFGLNAQADIAVRQSASVVLVEPWGLRLNGYLSGTFDDYGLVVLNDRNREFRHETPTAQQLMAHPDAQVYAVSDGSAAVHFGVDIGTGTFTQITTDYVGDLRAYELGNSIYVAFFVKNGENYRFGEVQKHNVYLLCKQALSMDLPESEKAVYRAMMAMYQKVNEYRK